MRWLWTRRTPPAAAPAITATVTTPLAVRIVGDQLRGRALDVLARSSRHLVIVDSFAHVTIEFRAGETLVVDGIDSELERAFVHHLADTLAMRIGLDRAGGNQDPRFIIVTVPDALIGPTATAAYRALLAIAGAR